MDFNIRTVEDIEAIAPAPAAPPAAAPPPDGPPPGGALPPAAPAPPAGPAAPATPPRLPTVDDFWAKLRKYLPAEVIGGYLLIYGLLRQILDDPGDLRALRVSILVLVALSAVLAYVGAATLHNVQRWQQQAISAAALVLWSIGDGSLLGTYDFWQPAMGSIALIAFGTIAAVVQLPPLPDP